MVDEGTSDRSRWRGVLVRARVITLVCALVVPLLAVPVDARPTALVHALIVACWLTAGSVRALRRGGLFTRFVDAVLVGGGVGLVGVGATAGVGLFALALVGGALRGGLSQLPFSAAAVGLGVWLGASLGGGATASATATLAAIAGVALVGLDVAAALHRLRVESLRAATELDAHRRRATELSGALSRTSEALSRSRVETSVQLEKLRRAYHNVKLLGVVGQKVMSKLTVGEIIDSVYQDVHALMDADVFAVGVYNKELDRLEFIGAKQAGETVPFHTHTLAEDHLPGIWAFKHDRSLFLNDYEVDYRRYRPDYNPVRFGDRLPGAALYQILHVDGEKFGVIFVHSGRKGAYEEHHADLLRSLAGFIKYAIANARAHELLADQSRRLRSANTEILQQKVIAEEERERSERLLANVLPSAVASELKRRGAATPRSYARVTVLFADFKGFSRIAERLAPEELVRELDRCFLAFDEIIARHGLEKIKTIGDAYMAAGGVPIANDTNPVDAVRAALSMRDFLEDNAGSHGGLRWEARFGLHTGPVIAGVIGKHRFAYDIWGDAVNLASRMESSGAPGKINISGETYALVRDHFHCSYRGEINVKHRGAVEMYWVEDAVALPHHAEAGHHVPVNGDLRERDVEV
ncbi:MAG: GAF domain-containing protein [Myxococcales bacterium]|nr:GAF domain-containing protein [Myxococcales bacterium]